VDRKSVVTKGNKHGPVAQVVMYTLAHVVQGRAALGFAIPEKIPAAVVVGKVEKKKSEARNKTSRLPRRGRRNKNIPETRTVTPKESSVGRSTWDLVHLATPNKCGGRYSFGVDAFGSLSDRDCAKLSLAAYLCVMASGMQVASEWLEQVRAKGSSDAAAPPALISGRALYFGDKQLEGYKVLASPVGRYSSHGFRIGQGELLEVAVDLDDLKAQASSLIFWCRDDPLKGVGAEDVLIKVTSIPCYNMLVRGTQSILFNPSSWKTRKDIVDLLSHSLHALYVTEQSTGLVQLLPNLKKQGFHPLRPEVLLNRFDCNWNLLWVALSEFVLGTLVTLADAGIIHADIRPGYDETANLFYSGKEIRMIDLDGLVLFTTWRREGLAIEHPKYIQLNELEGIHGALDFVYLQVIIVAETWLGKLKNRDVNANALLARSGLLTDLGKLVVDVARIREVLESYEKRFDDEDRRRTASNP
jgi:hypothetical protein